MNTLYDVLGVPRHANEKTIRTAFRKAAKSFHPDLNAGDPTAELQFRQIVAAYELLKNPEQREAYDQQLKENRRQRLRRIASPIISGVVSGSVVAAVMLWLNAQKPSEPAQAPRLAVTELDETTNQQALAIAKEDANREGGGRRDGTLPPSATNKNFPDDEPRQFAGLPPLSTEPEAQTPLAREWERVQATGDVITIWGFAVRNPNTPEAELARARLLTLIERSDNVFLLHVLRIGAPDAIAERARARLAHLGVPMPTDEASASPAPLASPLEERAAAFVSAQIGAWFPANNRNFTALTRAYAEEVYYNGSLKPRATVTRDKRRLFERTPERVYGVQLGSIRTECVESVCRVAGVMEWHARSTARASAAGTAVVTGAEQFEYGLIFARGVFSILSENSSPLKVTIGPEARSLPSRQEAAKQQASRQGPKQEAKQEPSAQDQEPSAREALKQEPAVQEPPDNP
jgi:curved DNA-binding protein CbpA